MKPRFNVFIAELTFAGCRSARGKQSTLASGISRTEQSALGAGEAWSDNLVNRHAALPHSHPTLLLQRNISNSQDLIGSTSVAGFECGKLGTSALALAGLQVIGAFLRTAGLLLDLIVALLLELLGQVVLFRGTLFGQVVLFRGTLLGQVVFFGRALLGQVILFRGAIVMAGLQFALAVVLGGGLGTGIHHVPSPLGVDKNHPQVIGIGGQGESGTRQPTVTASASSLGLPRCSMAVGVLGAFSTLDLDVNGHEAASMVYACDQDSELGSLDLG